MVRSTSRAATLLALALGLSGCLSGHALEIALRRELLHTYREACLAGDRVLVRYGATVTDDAGAPRGDVERWVAVDLAELRRPSPLPVDTVRVTPLAAAAPCAAGTPLPIVGAGAPDTPALLIVPQGEGPGALALRDGDGVHAPVYAGAFTRVRTAPWVYPALLVTVPIDAATTPLLLMTAPTVMSVGD